MIAAGVFGERVKRFVTTLGIDYEYSIERRSGSARAALLGITNGLGGSNIMMFVKQWRNHLLISGVLESNICWQFA